MINQDLIKEIQDMRYLQWDKTKESSGLAGSFLKAYEVRDGKKIYYKLSSYDPIFGITRKECFNELIVSRLLNLLNVPHLDYRLIHARISVSGKEYDTWLCASEDFKQTGDRKITLEDFYDLEKNGNESVLSFLERMGWLNLFYQMIVIDFLIINRDRHGANIEIIHRKRNDILEPAPFFDHGLSFLCGCRDEDSIKNFNPMADLPVQSFLGSRSLFYNLQLIKEKQFPVFRPLSLSDRDYLFDGLQDLLPPLYLDKIAQILFERWEYYENLRNHR